MQCYTRRKTDVGRRRFRLLTEKIYVFMNHVRNLTRMRDAELLRDYREKLAEAMKTGGEINRQEIVRAVILGCRPRYYLNFDQAYNVMSEIKTHGLPCRKLTLKQQMWMEIYGKVKQLIEQHPNLAVHAALARVLLNERASRYFISEDYAYKRLYRVQNSARRNVAQKFRA